MIAFTVPGPPKPLQRARVGRMGAHARMYDPEANTTNKATVGLHGKQAMEKWARLGNGGLLIGPLQLDVTFYIEKPKSKIRKNSDPFPYPDSKPDLDNCIKLVCDALNGIVWKDDCQVVGIAASKAWAPATGPYTDIRIDEV